MEPSSPHDGFETQLNTSLAHLEDGLGALSSLRERYQQLLEFHAASAQPLALIQAEMQNIVQAFNTLKTHHLETLARLEQQVEGAANGATHALQAHLDPLAEQVAHATSSLETLTARYQQVASQTSAMLNILEATRDPFATLKDELKTQVASLRKEMQAYYEKGAANLRATFYMILLLLIGCSPFFLDLLGMLGLIKR
jgi:predicted  nucleic acid-binding Zn-ribbon protein